jgi:RpiR family transcriptional regulator, carbohydrate utilization regulator
VYHEQVREIYDRLSPSYRRIADFLLNNYREAAFMTAAQLGRAAGADTTSVVRFAQRLGYPGFPELIAEIRAQVKQELRAVYDTVSLDNPLAAQFQRSLIEDRRSLDFALSYNDGLLIDTIVRLLGSASRVLVVGESAAHMLAELFALRLCALGLSAWCPADDSLSRATFTIRLRPNDVVVGLAPIMIERVAAVLQLARESGSHTVAIASTANIRAAQVAEHVLYVPSRAPGLFYSTTGLNAVVTALVQALTLHRSEASSEGAMQTDHLLRRYMQLEYQEMGVTLHDAMRDWTVQDSDGPAT